jgi:amidase
MPRPAARDIKVQSTIRTLRAPRDSIALNAGHQLFFDKDIPPVMFVRRGEALVVEAPDCACGLIRSRDDVFNSADEMVDRLGGFNVLCGPIAIEGVEAGDALAVTLIDIDPAPLTGQGFCALVPGFGSLTHDNGLGVQPSLPPATTICAVDREKVTVPLESGTVTLPCRPLVGCIGVAPSRERRMTLSQSADYVGDIDIPYFRAASTLHLRANHSGGLLSIGDVHAAQGDGEFTGMAVEVAADITIRVDVFGREETLLGRLPILTDERRVGVIAAFQGTSTADCIRAGGVELAALLQRLGMGLSDALQLLSVAARVRIGNAFEPFYSAFVYLERDAFPVEVPSQLGG